ncbi:hypothetical protein BT63DRAFT_427967 [Microthyrium microscopicum]|uniref:Copper transport protein n=1 Tax=Microthyrium microscopicum TaxID=703497 RepID=A0A6A6U3C8_9PEZI|nr:hypothetical protein BT63DRAFT_427967 [Microthyrium microscopicum]
MDMPMDTANMTMMMTSSGMMLAKDMAMVFFNAHNTPLYSENWAPASTGAYAGTCIFLIILGITLRALLASKASIEAKWADQAWNRRYIVVHDNKPLSERIEKDPDAKTGVLTANGVEEHVRMIGSGPHGVQPWRFSVDLPRAAIVTAIAGVGYLLMLAVMTLNVGYFLSVLAGTFVGEVAVGRYHSSAGVAH